MCWAAQPERHHWSIQFSCFAQLYCLSVIRKLHPKTTNTFNISRMERKEKSYEDDDNSVQISLWSSDKERKSSFFKWSRMVGKTAFTQNGKNKLSLQTKGLMSVNSGAERHNWGAWWPWTGRKMLQICRTRYLCQLGGNHKRAKSQQQHAEAFLFWSPSSQHPESHNELH